MEPLYTESTRPDAIQLAGVAAPILASELAHYSAAAKPDRHGMPLEAEKVALQGAELDGLQLESGVGSARPPRACFLSTA